MKPLNLRDNAYYTDLKSRGLKTAKARESVIVISGESITTSAAAERVGITRKQMQERITAARRKLQDGERLTWEALTR